MGSAVKIAIWWQQDSWGGVDSHLAALLNAWPRTDRFTVFYNSGNRGFQRIERMIAAPNIEPVAFSSWQTGGAGFASRVMRYLLLPWRFWTATRWVRRLLAAHGPFDAMIAENGAYPGAWSCLAALKAARDLGIKKRMLVVHHAAASYTLGRRLFEKLVDRSVQRWATDLVAVSQATRQSLLSLRGFDAEVNPIRVVHNGISVPQTIAAERALRARWGFRADDFLVGIVGRIERYKGHDDLLEGIAKVRCPLREHLRLAVVGTGSEQEVVRLKSMAERMGLSNSVQFIGYVDEDPVTIARQFDLLAMVTKDFEGFGLSIAEAMAAGTPVLATTVGGVPEFISDDVAMLIPPESPSEIARCLEYALASPEALAQRAKKAKAHIAGFTAEVMADKFQRLLMQ